MNYEWLYIATIPAMSALFAIGGTGFKFARRYCLPAILFAGLFMLGVAWWLALPACGLLCGGLHLGYGESKPYWYKSLVGLSYYLPALFIGWTLWIALSPIIFVVTFRLSNYSGTRKDFVWKACELIFGFLIGITYFVAWQRYWLS